MERYALLFHNINMVYIASVKIMCYTISICVYCGGIMQNKVVNMVMEKYTLLSVSERKIADFLFEHSEMFTRMSTIEIKAATGVSEPTIFRFCKNVGFSGIKELKLSLAQSLAPIEEDPVPNEAAQSGLTAFITRSFIAEQHVLENTLKLMDYELMEKTAIQIMSTQRICLFGIGTSYLVCAEMQRKFQALGLNIWSFQEYTDALALLRTMTENDLLICVSHSGESAASLQIVKDAKRLYIKSILFTSFPSSNCARYCDTILKTYAPELPGSRSGISSRVSQFALLDALYLIIVYMKDPEMHQKIEKTNMDIFNTHL